jgi:hypothetical protein
VGAIKVFMDVRNRKLHAGLRVAAGRREIADFSMPLRKYPVSRYFPALCGSFPRETNAVRFRMQGMPFALLPA